MALLEGEHLPKADDDREEGMLSKIVSSENVVDNVNVSIGRGNVVGVDINPEKSKEIKVSLKHDVPIQVLDDDSRLPDVVLEQGNLEMKSSMRSENLPQRLSVGELNAKMVESDGSHFDSKISIYDEFSASGPSKALVRTPQFSMGHHYEVGDLVWGKVKSHPWWPGHIYSDTFASPAVRRTKRPGHYLVAFFGDSSYGWFPTEELVPFEPNFDEKSQQTNSRNFVKAVEEAVDEIRRRSGMGLSCRCRNTYNFRPTKFEGYFSVDINGHELGGIYSMNQIEKARDLLQPKKTLDNIKIAAQMPLDVDYHDIRVIHNNAATFAYRRSVYEEFDETYALAFGQKPIHRPPISSDTIAQTDREIRAPLSGPLVIPEAMGKKKSSPKLNKAKETIKDKFLFKRRDEPNEQNTKPNQQMENSNSPPPNTERVSSVQTPVEKPSSSERENTDSKLKTKKTKVFKRPVTEIKVEKKSVQLGEMKKKRKKMEMSSEPNKEAATVQKEKPVPELTKEAATVHKEKPVPEPNKEAATVHNEKPVPEIVMQDSTQSGNQNLKLPELLRSLEGLANDPFYNSDTYSPKTVKDAFLRFRSHVYQKSESPLSVKSESEHPKPLISRPDDPTKGGKKREPSDRLEESSSKRVKKINDLKTAITRPPHAKPAERTKPAERPPRVREPTALVIKFPPHFSLPSSSELKARLSRFGPLDHLGTRVYYTTQTCRVVFLFKSDAMAANNHLSGTSRLFGNVQVMCHLRDMATQMAEPEPNKTLTEDTTSNEPLKSCLKKPPSDEAGDMAKGRSRVKFILGGEETSRNANFPRTGTISSSTAISFSGDFDGNTTTTFINKPVSSLLPPAVSYTLPPPPPLPTISPIPNAPLSQNMQVNVVDVPGSSKKVDIAPQMLGLLAQCSDVVATLRNHFGYIPHHPL
ncbi:PWWP domain-containing protein 1-like [Impatiens glandulifera]|uniref:PWWP domain-containing protein 1-like n=1 Tax=Impatiens glandulifera TaxID=253017 RepID=UPI001FB09331|nr:PWWP domain-containing protein 1-like [Impatiens glandulifera]